MAIKIKGDTIITDGNESGNNSSIPLWNNHLLPSGDRDWDLGKAAYRWNNLWIYEKANIGGNCDIGVDLDVGGNIDAGGHIDAGTWISATNYKVNNQEVISSDRDISARKITLSGTNTVGGNVAVEFTDITPHIFSSSTEPTAAMALGTFTVMDGKFQTVTLGGTRYCPALASTTFYSQTNGYFNCWTSSRDSGALDGWANSEGIIGHYTHTNNPTQYLSQCELYDINCLQMGYQPAYMYPTDGMWAEGQGGSSSYQGIQS